jgi:hypothetical protein
VVPPLSSFGQRSLGRLDTCPQELKEVCFEVVPVYNCTVICGARGEREQTEAYENGYSNAPWPQSKHNAVFPGKSNAIDIAPWFPDKPHIRWNHEREFVYLAGHIMQAAQTLGIELRWGGDWDQDKDLFDRNLPFDLGHFERVNS